MTPDRAPGSYAGLTQRQADLLSLLRRAEAEERTMSFQEMAGAIGLRAKSNIARLMDGLVERGYVTKIKDRARAYRLVDSATVDLSAVPIEALLAEVNRRAAMIRAIGTSR